MAKETNDVTDEENIAPVAIFLCDLLIIKCLEISSAQIWGCNNVTTLKMTLV